MKILHINAIDTVGGAAIVARRLMLAQNAGYAAMGEPDWPSSMLVGHKIGTDSCVQEVGIVTCTNDFEKYGELGWSRTDMSGITEHPWVEAADVIHLHNLHGGYFNPCGLIPLSQKKPIVWTLHDMTPITGHCAHSYDCEKWKDGCGGCEHLDTYPELSRDVSDEIWQTLRQIYRHCDLTIVCPTMWLARKVYQSILGEHPVYVVPNGVPPTFAPMDVSDTREKMGLKPDDFVIGSAALCGALQNRWKGGRDAIQVVERTGVKYLNIGSGKRTGHPRVIDTEHIDTTTTNGEITMAHALSCLDVFLYPTYADNCPLAVLEAMACGVPVVGYNVGGMPELVRSGQDGWLYQVGDVDGLCRDIEELKTSPEIRATLGRNARQNVVENYQHADIARRYADIYTVAIAGHNN